MRKLDQREVKNWPKVIEIALRRVKIPTQNSLHTFNYNTMQKATLIEAVDTNACEGQQGKDSHKLRVDMLE